MWKTRVAKEREPLRAAQFDVLRRMSGDRGESFMVRMRLNRLYRLKMPDVSVTYSYKSRYYDDEDDDQWYEDGVLSLKKTAPGTIGA